MMSWAEEAARREGISREEADRWAIRSHQRAIAAQDAGTFTKEILPIPVRDCKGGETPFALDEGPRRDTTLEKIAKLKPVYPDGVYCNCWGTRPLLPTFNV